MTTPSRAHTRKTQKMATRTTNDLVVSLRDASPRNCTQDRLLFLCVRAADEIERLQKVIDDYVYIAAASAREIKALRERATDK